MLGGLPRPHVSNMERGICPVSMKTARKLAKIFKVSPGSLSDSTVMATLASLETLLGVVNRPTPKNRTGPHGAGFRGRVRRSRVHFRRYFGGLLLGWFLPGLIESYRACRSSMRNR